MPIPPEKPPGKFVVSSDHNRLLASVRELYSQKEYGPRGGTEIRIPVRMKIKTAADSSGVAICNFWDGSNAGATDIPVRMSSGKGKVGEQLWATQCWPNAAVTYSSKAVFWIEVVIGETSSPTTFSPSGTTAESTTWSQQSNGTPVTIALQTRAAYDTSGHILYHFTREFAFDDKGRLVSISGETRVTTDTAESCA